METEDILFQSTPPDLREEAEAVMGNLLPEKSKEKYEAAYNTFHEWRTSRKTNSSSETVLLAYFKFLSETKASTTLWSIFSMLKSTIKLREKTNIGSYAMLIAFLKKLSVESEPKQSAVFSNEQVRRFLDEAPDSDYLVTKVVLVMGIMGACRGQEITDIKIEDIREEGRLLVVTLPKTKTHQPRSFVINEEFVDIIKKYQALRPPQARTDRFFLNYKNGKCTVQVIGKHKIASMPKSIAQFLKLANPEKYTGHSFRRSSATIFSNQGGNMIDLKDLGGWKSDAVAQRYVQSSVQNKSKISNILKSAIHMPVNKDSEIPAGNSRQFLDVSKVTNTVEQISNSKQVFSSKGDITMNNCTVHIHNYPKQE